MTRIAVAGLINIETTLKVSGFPIEYEPTRYPFFGVRSTVSGVGYNIAKALTTLGNDVRFMSMIGEDAGGILVHEALRRDNIPAQYVLTQLDETAQSVILYDPDGKRAIYTDLKDIQDMAYPVESFEQAVQKASLAVVCNINFMRPYLDVVKAAGIPIATDVHTIADLEDEYNSDYMAAADILFMSDERLPRSPEKWARDVQSRYGNEIIVIGLGEKGALLSVKSDGYMARIPSHSLRKVVNTIGAGDALFSSFVHTYIKTGDPYESIQKAVIFASYKIGEKGAAEGFLTQDRLDGFYDAIHRRG